MLKAKIRFSERLCVTWFSLAKIIFVFAGFRWRLLRQRFRVFAAAKRESELKHEQALTKIKLDKSDKIQGWALDF